MHKTHKNLDIEDNTLKENYYFLLKMHYAKEYYRRLSEYVNDNYEKQVFRILVPIITSTVRKVAKLKGKVNINPERHIHCMLLSLHTGVLMFA